MEFYSISNPKLKASFKEAVLRGIASDKGLYFPSEIPLLSNDFIASLSTLSNREIAFEVIKPFAQDSISEEDLERIIEKTLSFDFPLVEIQPDIYCLELFQGPTLAFKDVGARFMAFCLEHFIKEKHPSKITVLVATSGDTGGAVANGFFGIEGIEVVVLYPKDLVSPIQQIQITTLGGNVHALEIDGTFDECQAFVKSAFVDDDIKERIELTSANSINVARWLPQMFYYFFALKSLLIKYREIIVSVPSGNFGNICAGMLAKKMGLPISRFVASTNINKTVVTYLETSKYNPIVPSWKTISNAMDVGDPSNFTRIKELYRVGASTDEYEEIRSNLSGRYYTDKQTRQAIKDLYKNCGYLSDPHSAVGYLGLTDELKELGNIDQGSKTGVFLGTAHPVKFYEEVEDIINKKIALPNQLENIFDKEKRFSIIKDYTQFKDFLLSGG